MNTNVKIFVSVIAILFVGTIATAVIRGGVGGPTGPGKYDTFATCLKDAGATFYGAFWCPHCQATKKMFGSSQKLLPYVECSTPDAKGQTPICTEKGVASYPTWEFADGTRLTGELTFETLAEKTSCVLPTDAASAPTPVTEEGTTNPAQ
jgi:thiol-disulfide isomerase/thioredoxin